MQIDTLNVLTIVGMALVTYATRAGGLWLMGRVQISRKIEVWFEYVPGAVMMAAIAPDIFTGGVAALGAAALTALVAVFTKNMLLAMVVGVVAIWLLRMIV